LYRPHMFNYGVDSMENNINILLIIK
jgi:hypothetical protein